MLYPDLNKLHILHYPDPRLRVPAQDLREISTFLQELTQRMGELMVQAQGIGLASTQVGWPYRFIVMSTNPEEGRLEAFVNPVIVAKEGRVTVEEGCLSLPGLFAKVRRHECVTVRATLPNGETVEMKAEGLTARCWQHEIDHLDGGLFVDRIGPAARIMLAARLREMEEEFKTNPPPDAPPEPKKKA